MLVWVWKSKKKHHECEKDFIWNTATCSCENGKYVISITSDLVITCVEILEATKNVPIKSTSTKTVPTRNSIYNKQNKFFIFYLPFY